MNHPARAVEFDGEHSLCNESGDVRPNPTHAESSLHQIVTSVSIHAGDLTPEQLESLVVMLKQWKATAVEVRDLPQRIEKERRGAKRHRERHPIRKMVRAAVVSLQKRMLGKEPPEANESASAKAFRAEIEGIKDRRALTRLENRAYLMSWASRALGFAFFCLLGIWAFLFMAGNIHWVGRAIVMAAALTAFYLSDRLMFDGLRAYAKREKEHFLAALKKANTVEELTVAGLISAPATTSSSSDRDALADKLYRI